MTSAKIKGDLQSWHILTAVLKNQLVHYWTSVQFMYLNPKWLHIGKVAAQRKNHVTLTFLAVKPQLP